MNLKKEKLDPVIPGISLEVLIVKEDFYGMTVAIGLNTEGKHVPLVRTRSGDKLNAWYPLPPELLTFEGVNEISTATIVGLKALEAKG